jgi:glycosyltransferase involved in cell wall biosynthesis
VAVRFAAAAGRKVAELARAGQIDLAEFAECEAAGAAYSLLRHIAPGGADRRWPAVPTVVHLHTPSEVLLVLRSFCSGVLTPGFAGYVLAERAGILGADALCAPSAFIADWAQRHYHLPDTPTVIPYAMDALPPQPPPAQKRRILYVGRIEPRKGVEPLVRAWVQIASAHPGWSLRLAGADTTTSAAGTSLRGHLFGLIPPELRGRIHFLGALRPELLAVEYAEASLCVVPSLWENYPSTCIEAMSHARAVLVSDEGGMREMIGDTAAGETFRSGDVADLARALSSMLNEGPDRLATRGRCGRGSIAALCDKASVASRRIAFYRSVIARAAAGPRRVDPMWRLSIWRDLERVTRGVEPAVALPRLRPRITQWIGAEATA